MAAHFTNFRNGHTILIMVIDTSVSNLRRFVRPLPPLFRPAQAVAPSHASSIRLQVTPELGFKEAAALTEYFARLGVGAVYMPPIMQGAGSNHNYHTTDPTKVDKSRGGSEALDFFFQACEERGISIILDCVPNHMKASEISIESPTFYNTLKHGRNHEDAELYEIDWDKQGKTPSGTDINGRVILPFMEENTVEEALANGRFTIQKARDVARDVVNDNYVELDEKIRDDYVLCYHSLNEDGSRGIPTTVLPLKPETELSLINGDAPLAPTAELLDSQHFLLASWRMSELRNTGRFWDVDKLIKLRMHDPKVYDRVVSPMLDQITNGKYKHLLAGVRFDYVDGLADPAAFVERAYKDLRNRYGGATLPQVILESSSKVVMALSKKLAEQYGVQNLFARTLQVSAVGLMRLSKQLTTGVPRIYPEKILQRDERLDADFPFADGTSGYQSDATIDALFTNKENAWEAFTSYIEYAGDSMVPELNNLAQGAREMQEVFNKAKQALESGQLTHEDERSLIHLVKRQSFDIAFKVLEAEISNLVEQAQQASNETNPGGAIARATSNDVRAALQEFIAGFEESRAYVQPGEIPSPKAQATIQTAVKNAMARLDEPQQQILDELANLALSIDSSSKLIHSPAVARFATHFAEVTAPLFAIAEENILNARFTPRLRNVGQGIHHSPLDIDGYIAWAKSQHARLPYSMTNRGTHDTRRAPDVQARLLATMENQNVLRELLALIDESCKQFEDQLKTINTPGEPLSNAHITKNIRWYMAQTILAAYPFEGITDPEHFENFSNRLQDYFFKFTQDASYGSEVRRTDLPSHVKRPRDPYAEKVKKFTEVFLSSANFRNNIDRFINDLQPIAEAKILGQHLMNILTLGPPDIYQGTGIVNLLLGDPDNRTPVDFSVESAMLDRLKKAEKTGVFEYSKLTISEKKLWLTHKALHFRKSHQHLFGEHAEVSRVPTSSEQYVAVQQSRGHDRCISVALRFPGEHVDPNATITLERGKWENPLTGAVLHLPRQTQVPMRDVLAGESAGFLVRINPQKPHQGAGLARARTTQPSRSAPRAA